MKKQRQPLLTEDDVTKAYKETLRAISIMRGSISDETRQLMADAVREFYGLLEEQIESRRVNLITRVS